MWTSPVYSGVENFTRQRAAPAVPYTPRNALLFHHSLTALREGGTAPATGTYGPRIKDELTRESISNAPPIENRLVDRADRRSHAELLTARIAALRDRNLQQGWELFRAGQFVRAIPCFEAAEMADRNSTDARLGVFCSAVMDESTSRAEAALLRIMKHDRGVFQVDFDVRTKLDNPDLLERLEWMVGVLGRTARQESERPIKVAVYAFHLWTVGQRSEAQRNADDIYRDHRASPFSPMAARMRGETASPAAEEGPGYDEIIAGQSQ